jgi:hypothetical protein
MSCVYHPNRDNVAFCNHCEAALCKSCTIRLEDGRTLCHRCMLTVSLEDVESETTLKKQQEEDRLVGLQKKWRPTYIHLVLVIGLIGILILLTLRLYWSQSEARPRVVLDMKGPVELLAALQETLAHYAAEHGNSYPDSLYELVPTYLPDLGKNRAALQYVEYNLDEKNGYLMRMKAGSPLAGENLVATMLDIYPTQTAE